MSLLTSSEPPLYPISHISNYPAFKDKDKTGNGVLSNQEGYQPRLPGENCNPGLFCRDFLTDKDWGILRRLSEGKP